LAHWVSQITMPPARLCITDVTFLMTTGRRIAAQIAVLTPSVKNYYGYKFGELWSSNPWNLVAHLHRWRVHAGCALDFKDHSLGGSSIASKKCTVVVCTCRAGYTLGFALLSGCKCYINTHLGTCFAAVNKTMSLSRKKVLLKMIILGDSGW